MRGRTLANAYVVLDEAQNATTMQMKMFLTRLGEGRRMAVTGDTTQIDLLRDAMVAAHDRDAELWITEIGWASGGPPNPLNRGLAGQADRLREAFKYFIAKRRKLNVEALVWYSWRDNTADDVQLCEWCPESGLLKEDRSPKPAFDAFTDFTGGTFPAGS